MSETKIIQNFTIKSAEKIKFLNEFAESIKLGARIKDGAYFFTSLPMRIDMEIELDSVEDALEDTPYRVVMPVVIPEVEEAASFKMTQETDLSLEEFIALPWTEMRKKAIELDFKATKKEEIIEEYKLFLERNKEQE